MIRTIPRGSDFCLEMCQEHCFQSCKWDRLPRWSDWFGSHRASNSLANLQSQVRMQIWLFSLLSLTAPFKRSHSPFHLFLRAWSYPSPPSTCAVHPGWAGVLTDLYFSLCLSSSLSCCFTLDHLCFCLWCSSLQVISPPLHLFWASWRSHAARFLAEQIWWCTWHFSISPTGLVLFRMKNVQFQVLSVLSCMGFPPDSLQNGCAEMQIHGRTWEDDMVSVMSPSKEDNNNGLYRISSGDGLDSGFKKWSLVRRDLIKVSKVTYSRKVLQGIPFHCASQQINKGPFRKKLANAIFMHFTHL